VDAPSVLAPAPRFEPKVDVVAVGAAVDAGAALEAGCAVLAPKRLEPAAGWLDGALDAALDVAVCPLSPPPKRPPVAGVEAVVVGAEVAAEGDAAGFKVGAGAALAAGFAPNRPPVLLTGSVVCFTPVPKSDGAVAIEEAGFDVVPAGDVREKPGAEGVEEGVEALPMAPKRGFEAAPVAGFAPNKPGAAAGAVVAGVVDCDACVLDGVCPMLPNRFPEAGALVLF
jgi:hypothetical protein